MSPGEMISRTSPERESIPIRPHSRPDIAPIEPKIAINAARHAGDRMSITEIAKTITTIVTMDRILRDPRGNAKIGTPIITPIANPLTAR